MSTPATGVRISVPEFYTEAHHTAHGRVTGDVPLYDSGSQGLMRPESLTAKYACRTTRGETDWHPDSMEMFGAWVTEDGEPDERKSAYPRATLLLYGGIEPEWGAEFSRAWFPHHLRLALPGRPARAATGDAERSAAPAEASPVSEVRTYTELAHTVYANVAGAGPLLVPAYESWRPDRWMLPTRVSVTWKQRSQSHITGWQLADLAVTGPWCNDLGERLPDEGHARWPGGGGNPEWLAEFISVHAPADTDGFTTDRAAG